MDSFPMISMHKTSAWLRNAVALASIAGAFFAATALAQQASQPNTTQPAPTAASTEAPKKAHVEGTVVSITGQAVPRAQVRLVAPNLQAGQLITPSAVTSDDAGKFVFDDIEPGRNYQLSAQRTGFTPGRYGARSANTPGTALTLDAGLALKGLVITLTPQGVISGKITDQNGDPIQSALVLLSRRGYQRGMRALVPSSTATSNDQGEYRVASLAPGRYYLSVSDRLTAAIGANSAPTNGRLGNITTYYPNSPDIQGAAAIDVTPGAEMRSVDVRFRTGKMYSVRGKAMNTLTGEAAGGVIVRTVSKESLSDQSILSQLTQSTAQTKPQDGSFEIRGLSPGTYMMQTLATGSLNGTALPKLVGALEINVADADVSGVVFQLGSGAVVTGTATLEGGDIKKVFPTGAPADPSTAALAAAAATAGVTIPGLKPSVALIAQGGAPTSTAAGTINDDGTFKVEAIGPAKYSLNVTQLPQGYYVKSATFGGTDILHSGLDLTSGNGGSLQIVLSDKPADITGLVTNDKGEPQANVHVTLWTKDEQPGNSTNGVKAGYTDQNGSFTFSGLAPDDYSVAAWEDVDPGLALSRDFLGQFSSGVEKQKLTQGGHAAVQLKMFTSEQIKAAEAKLP